MCREPTEEECSRLGVALQRLLYESHQDGLQDRDLASAPAFANGDLAVQKLMQDRRLVFRAFRTAFRIAGFPGPELMRPRRIPIANVVCLGGLGGGAFPPSAVVRP